MRNARKEAVFINNKAWKHRSAALSWKAACWLRWRWTRLKSSAQSKFSSGKNLRGCYHIWACTSEACVYTLWAWNIHVTIHEWEAQARVVGVISYVSMHEWGLCAHLVGVEYTCHHTRVKSPCMDCRVLSYVGIYTSKNWRERLLGWGISEVQNKRVRSVQGLWGSRDVWAWLSENSKQALGGV